MAFTTRHLRAVPDPQPLKVNIDGTLRWLHVLNGIIRQERETRHLIKEAQRLGKPEAVNALELALDCCETAKGALR